MNETSYVFRKPKDDLFLFLSGMLFIIFSGYILFENYREDKFQFTVFIIPLLFIFLGILLIRIFGIRQQYYKIDRDKTVNVSKGTRKISIEKNGLSFTITHSDIESVEIFSSWNTLPLFSTLGYIRFCLHNQESFIITRFTADESVLSPIITGQKVKYIRKLMNKL